MTDSLQVQTPPDDILVVLPEEAELEICTQKLHGRHRCLTASILVPCSVERLWQVLTDYDNLAEVVPNLTLSRRIGTSESGTLLEQVGTQCFLNIKFCARVVLNMVEQFPTHLGFEMVEGDFKLFKGAWKLEAKDEAEGITRLIYELMICPPRAVPTLLIERHLRRDLTQNLQAIRQHAMTIAEAT